MSVLIGEYRNRSGQVIHVTGLFSGSRKTLGGIYEAYAPDELFGSTPYLVTEDSLYNAGYRFVDGAS